MLLIHMMMTKGKSWKRNKNVVKEIQERQDYNWKRLEKICVGKSLGKMRFQKQ